MQALVDQRELSIDIKNIYLMSPLQEREVIYYVPKNKVDFYGVKEHTSLDLVYVLDVLPEKYEKEKIIDYSEDMNRYSFQDPVTREHLEAQKQTYEYAVDEWGTTITGYAPLYAIDGEYLGLVGVDVTPDAYNSFNDKAVASIFFVFLLSVGLLIVEMIYVLVVFNRMQEDKVYFDALTKIYNRRFYNEKLNKMLNKKLGKQRYVVCSLLDIDLFKGFNDLYGHRTGDDCLIQFVKEVKKALPPKLSYLIRYGGEEFVACFTAESEEEIRSILIQMQENIATIELESVAQAVTCSIGCCYCAPAEFEKITLDELLKTADQNLYYVKQNGRNDHRISKYSA
jgi:diguanylate cyclase (GGDEF)-like protein